jgi:hypothetical protein
MNMKEHILAALGEQFGQWEELLASLGDDQLTTPIFDEGWSIKDVTNHLWGWQQISIARVEAGVNNLEPVFPEWLTNFPIDWDEEADQTNAWIFKVFHDRSWEEAFQHWRGGFLRLLDQAERVSERDLLDADRYLWLDGYSLAFILVASYEHHQEHLDKIKAWLQEHAAQNRKETTNEYH